MENNQNPWFVPPARPMETLGCIGQVTEFGPLSYKEESGNYSFKVVVKGIAGSRSVNEFFTFKPKFFAADFNFNDLSNNDQFLYRKYIVDTDNGQLSLLAAICGSQERFSALGRLRFERLGDNPTAEEMVALMQEFTISNGSVPFAYVLKQEKKKDGSLTNNYRVSERYWLDTEEKAQKRITGFLERQKRSQERAAAAEAAGKERTGEAFRVSFDLSQIA